MIHVDDSSPSPRPSSPKERVKFRDVFGRPLISDFIQGWFTGRFSNREKWLYLWALGEGYAHPTGTIQLSHNHGLEIQRP